MKKLALIIAFMMLIPCSAFGMQMLNNSSMDKITGQSGVSIDFDDVQIFMHIDKMAYIDSDGITNSLVTGNSNYGAETTSNPGAIAINDFTINLLNVNAIVGTVGQSNAGFATGAAQSGPNMRLASSGVIPLFYNYATAGTGAVYLTTLGAQSYGLSSSTYINPLTGGHPAASGSGSTYFVPRFLTIDVSNNMPCATAAFQYITGSTIGSIGGVVIGIPTMEIYINGMTLTPYFTGDIAGVTASTDTAHNNLADYGTFQLSGITLTTLSGWVEIAPH